MSFLAHLFGGLLSRVLAVVLALAAAQLPVYYAQYLQTLSGARVEAQGRYEELVREAGALNLDAEDFIVRHEENSDPVFQSSGRIHRSTLARFTKLDTAWRALSQASVLNKPAALLRHYDPAIAKAVPFEPGVPLTMEAAGYALAGVVAAWLLSTLFGALLLPPARGKTPLAPAAKPRSESATARTEPQL